MSTWEQSSNQWIASCPLISQSFEAFNCTRWKIWVCKAEKCRARRCSQIFFRHPKKLCLCEQGLRGFPSLGYRRSWRKIGQSFPASEHVSTFGGGKKETAVGTEISFDASAHFIKLVTQSKSSSLAQIQFAWKLGVDVSWEVQKESAMEHLNFLSLSLISFPASKSENPVKQNFDDFSDGTWYHC